MFRHLTTVAVLLTMAACSEGPTKSTSAPETDSPSLSTTSSASSTSTTVVFTSSPSTVQAWGPILKLPVDLSNWPSTECRATPTVGLDDPRWGSPHASYAVGPAAFEGWAPWANFNATWINAWNSLEARNAPGAQNGNNTQSWAKFATTVSGQGSYVVQFLADNCSWIYLDDTLIGVQDAYWNSGSSNNGRYGLNLSGSHTLTFIVFDGGGQAGGKFRLETVQSFEDNGGNTGDINPPPPPSDTTPPTITPSVSGTLGANDWYTSDVSVTWTVSDDESDLTNTTGCDATTISEDTAGVTFTCSATSAGGSASASVSVKRDATTPAITFSGNAGSYTVDQSVTIACSASDNLSGIASSACPGASGDAFSFGVGTTTLAATATDLAGNSYSASTSFTVTATAGSVCELVKRWVTQRGVANSLCQQLNNKAYGAFANHVRSQTGKFVPADKAAILIALSRQL